MFKLQVKQEGNEYFNTVATFITNPDYDSMDFLSELFFNTFVYYSKKKIVPFTPIGIHMDFDNYCFELKVKENKKIRYLQCKYRHFEVQDKN